MGDFSHKHPTIGLVKMCPTADATEVEFPKLHQDEERRKWILGLYGLFMLTILSVFWLTTSVTRSAHLDTLIHSLQLHSQNITPIRDDMMTYQASYPLMFTLVLAEPNPADSLIRSWHIRPAIQQYVEPVLNVLSTLTSFQTYSNIVFGAEMDVKAVYDAHLNGFTLSFDSLAYFIKSGSWLLDAPLIKSSMIHFVLFVPPKSISPLYILDASGKVAKQPCFLIPQWGGLCIANSHIHSETDLKNGVPGNASPSPDLGLKEEETLSVETLAPFLQIFMTHLATLFHLAPVALYTPSMATLQSHMASVEVLWKKHLLDQCKKTYQSMLFLLDAMPNIPVSDTVASKIISSLEAFHHATQGAEREDVSLSFAKKAYQDIQDAYFDAGMMGQLYFPELHKWAVYLPLLFPICLPILFALLKLVKDRRKLRRERNAPLKAKVE